MQPVPPNEDQSSCALKDTHDDERLSLQEQISTLEIRGSSLDQILQEKYREKVKLCDQLLKPSFMQRTRSRLGFKSQHPSVHGQLKALAADIEDRENILRSLIQNLDSARAVLESHNARREQERTDELSRVNQRSMSKLKLPAELWAEIFFFCLPADDFILPHPSDAPLLLCQICRAWRDIALNTPHLWASLSIRRPTRKTCIKSWMDRSGEVPLSLEVSIIHFMEPTFDSTVSRLILSTKDRWFRLRLDLSEHLMSAIINHSFPMLHTIQFGPMCSTSSITLDSTRFPRLRAIHLVSDGVQAEAVALPWDKLTHCSFCWLTLSQHIEVLRKCPRLKSYQLHLAQSCNVPQPPLPIALSFLETLAISASIGSAMGAVLTCLELPALCHLRFAVVPTPYLVGGANSWPQEQVLSLVERSSCNLETITFDSFALSHEDLVHLHGIIPSLRSIELLDT
ncbi:hypothetical protein NLJ89_g2195 [Agrocybe chaxingu]|uniref:F-box domain-containing protein n=1 Tax=Agrocybe chaxingu TaxID=84603 RepID=A0A9W8K7Y0_9AGAR|nr:hypothetical protein NLJ89_g2195 [Agrocybe chaxingu]